MTSLIAKRVQYLEDIEGDFPEPISKGSTIYLVRKISGEILAVTLDIVLTGAKPMVEVSWDTRHRYKLDLVKNEVIALDATTRHRQNMKSWYYIWEPHKMMLTALFWEVKRGKKA